MTAKATKKGDIKECYLCPGTCVTHVLTLKSLRFEPINRLEFAINRCDEILEVFIRYDVKSQRRGTKLLGFVFPVFAVVHTELNKNWLTVAGLARIQARRRLCKG